MDAEFVETLELRLDFVAELRPWNRPAHEGRQQRAGTASEPPVAAREGRDRCGCGTGTEIRQVEVQSDRHVRGRVPDALDPGRDGGTGCERADGIQGAGGGGLRDAPVDAVGPPEVVGDDAHAVQGESVVAPIRGRRIRISAGSSIRSASSATTTVKLASAPK